jgi:AraC-like DNA-binding protein
MAKTQKFTKSDGTRNMAVAQRVVKMRTSANPVSWAQIAEKLGCSPRTARKMFDEAQGQDAHFDNRPLVGGRHRHAPHKNPNIDCWHNVEGADVTQDA